MPHRMRTPPHLWPPPASRTCYDPSVSVPLSQPGEPIRIGISSCLLGQKVRFDGGHKRDSFLTDTLGRYVEWVPVCPEVEVGMGTPRETVHLVRDVPRSSRTGEGVPVRMVAPGSGVDWTDRMVAYAQARVAKLAALDLSGYVLKKDSPSCGMERVKVHAPGAMPERSGTGLYAAALRARMPTLPIEEEGRLCEPRLRENFVERVFAYRRLRTLFAGRWSVGQLVRFHTAHKLILLAHATGRVRVARPPGRAGAADASRGAAGRVRTRLHGRPVPCRHTARAMRTCCSTSPGISGTGSTPSRARSCWN